VTPSEQLVMISEAVSKLQRPAAIWRDLRGILAEWHRLVDSRDVTKAGGAGLRSFLHKSSLLTPLAIDPAPLPSFEPPALPRLQSRGSPTASR